MGDREGLHEKVTLSWELKDEQELPTGRRGGRVYWEEGVARAKALQHPCLCQAKYLGKCPCHWVGSGYLHSCSFLFKLFNYGNLKNLHKCRENSIMNLHTPITQLQQWSTFSPFLPRLHHPLSFLLSFLFSSLVVSFAPLPSFAPPFPSFFLHSYLSLLAPSFLYLC